METKFGALLRQMRARARRGVNETARAAGVSSSYLSRVELGKDAPMSTRRSLDVARFLKADPLPLIREAIEHRGEARLPLANLSRQRVDFAVQLEARWVDGSLGPKDIEALMAVLHAASK